MIESTGRAGSITVPVQPEYLRIIDDVNELVESGRWPAGHRVPRPAELAAEYHVSVGTVRRALDLLKDRGVLEGRQGKGVYVAERATPTA